MILIEKFKIKIPHAFRPAIDSCHFNEGDVIHDHYSAYISSDWEYAKKQLKYSITVTKASLNTKDTFITNWFEPITIEVYNHKSKTAEHFHTTNGGLFRYLETSNLKWVTTPFNESPPIPLREFKKIIRHTNPLTLNTLIPSNAKDSITYFLPHCVTSEVAIKKIKSVQKALKPFNPKILTLNSEKLRILLDKELPEFSVRLKPTIELVCFTISRPFTYIHGKVHFSDFELQLALATTKQVKYYFCPLHKDKRLYKPKPFNLSNHLIKVKNHEL